MVLQLLIDNREPKEIIDEIQKNNNIKTNYKINIVSLPLFDYIIAEDDFDINYFEESLDKIKILIERKSEQDLLSSIKDGRYREQSFRMENLNIEKSKIFYLIEESRIYSKNLDLDKKVIQSALISLTYFKKFSLFYTKNKIDSGYLIYKFLDKITTTKNGDNKDNNYVSCIKVNKRDNVTPENIDIIMLMQIPNISNNIAIVLIEKYGSISNLINIFKDEKHEIQNIKINDRKISKKVIENLEIFLHIK